MVNAQKNPNSNHLKALMRKNFILWTRNPFCSCCEIFLPAALTLLLFILRANIDKTDLDEYSYIKNNEQVPLMPDPIPREKLPIDPDTKKPLLPIKDCLKGRNRNYPSFRNGHIAIVANDRLFGELTEKFMTYGY